MWIGCQRFYLRIVSRRGGGGSSGLENYIFMLLAFCAMQPIEKQINPLASMPIDSIFSFGVPLICRCPAMTRAEADATNGRAAQLHFIRSDVN